MPRWHSGGLAIHPGYAAFFSCSPTTFDNTSVPSGKEQRRFENAYGLQDCYTRFSPDGKLLAVWRFWGGWSLGHSSIRLWDVATGRELGRTYGHQAGVKALAVTPDGGMIVSGGMDRTVRLWESRTGKELRVYGGHEDDVYCVAVSTDGRCVASVDKESGMHLWDAQTGKVTAKFPVDEFGHILHPVSFTPDGKHVLAHDGSDKIQVIDVRSGKCTRRIDLGVLAEYVTTSLSGRLLATLETDDESRHIITVRDGSTGRPHYVIKAEERETLYDLAFSRDGKFLSAKRYIYPDIKIGGTIQIPPQDHQIRVWEVATAKEVSRIKLSHELGPCSFSSDGGGLIAPFSNSHDEMVLRYWDLEGYWTGDDVPAGHLDGIYCLALSADGRTLVTGSADGTLLVRDMARLPLVRRGSGSETLENTVGLWTALNGDDCIEMQEAFGRLSRAADSTVPFLREFLTPVAAVDAPTIRQLIDDLDSNSFYDREYASAELEKLAELAEPALRKALETSRSAEASRRIKRLLAKLETPLLSGAQLQAVRVTTLLERIGTSEARRLLEDLAKGAPEARLTRESKASLERLSSQP